MRPKKKYNVSSGDDVYVLYYRRKIFNNPGGTQTQHGIEVFPTIAHAKSYLQELSDAKLKYVTVYVRGVWRSLVGFYVGNHFFDQFDDAPFDEYSNDTYGAIFKVPFDNVVKHGSPAELGTLQMQVIDAQDEWTYADIATACVKCGKYVDKSWSYCPNCGHKNEHAETLRTMIERITE